VGELPAPLFYLLASWGAVTSVLVVLVIYRATLSTREDDEIHLNKTADSMMAAEQRQIVGKLNKLTRPIVTLVVLSSALLLACAGVWIWGGLKSF
jgi:hypothetical protein